MPTIDERYLNAKRALFDRVYSDLNERQREAVYTVNGPLLVLAGAGSGKTTVLVRRIAFLIRYGNAYYSNYVPYDLDEQAVTRTETAYSLPPERIAADILPEFESRPCEPYRVLAITFTNKAANEIKSRLAAMFPENGEIAKQIVSGTFHSVCLRILRRYYDRIGYGEGFTIYDADDTKKALLTAMRELGIDEKMLPVKGVQNAISRAKDRLLSPDGFEMEAGSDFRAKQIFRIYERYQQNLRSSNAMDFDDIIMQTVLLLKRDETVRRTYQQRFRYVCVDEFQDTNVAQLQLTVLLAGGYNNLMVVGDDDQSIYRFRGATIENILQFDQTYPDAKVIKLEQNYRSTQNILNAANAVIAHNEGRKGKELWTSGDVGSKIHLRLLDDQNIEARFIVDTVSRTVARKEATFRDFAVLYRTNAQSNSIEKAFARAGVPYRVLGGTRFSDRKEIRDAVAYLQLVNNHNDNARLERIINEPKRKIGKTTLAAIHDIAIEENCSQFDVIDQVDRYPALARSRDALKGFAALIHSLTELSARVSPDVLFDAMLDRSGYRQMLIDGGPEEAERLENLDEFKSGIIEYLQENEAPTLTGFLEETALVADVDRYDETADAVVMMTVHSAKGLEFPIVFLPGMEDGLFPGIQTINAGESDMEEERRLAYVAITRAKKELYLLHTRNRLLYGQTMFNPLSRFVSEIPSSLTDAEEQNQRTGYGREGVGYGQSNGYGYEQNSGYGYGQNSGYGYGQSNGYGYGQSNGYGYGQNNGYGYGRDGFGYGSASGYRNRSVEPAPTRSRTYYTEPEEPEFSPQRRTGSVRFETPSVGKSPSATAKKAELPTLVPGDKVRHLTFGDGEILTAKPVGADILYEVIFDRVGTKKLMATYAKLKKI